MQVPLFLGLFPAYPRAGCPTVVLPSSPCKDCCVTPSRALISVMNASFSKLMRVTCAGSFTSMGCWLISSSTNCWALARLGHGPSSGRSPGRRPDGERRRRDGAEVPL